MKKYWKLGLFTILAILLAGCPWPPEPDPDPETETNTVVTTILAFSSGTLSVTNNGTEALVLFKDSIDGTTVIKNGSAVQVVPGTAINFKVNAPKGLYVIKAIKLSDLEANGFDYTLVGEAASQIISVEDTVADLQISAATTGNAILEVTNTTNFYVELHQDSFAGPAIAIVRPNGKSTFRFPPGEYNIYPISIEPQMSGTKLVGIYKREIVDAKDIKTLQENRTVTMEIRATITPVHITAYLEITNEVAKGLKLHNGDLILSSVMGHTSINTGGIEVYPLEVDPVSGTRRYGILTLKDINLNSYQLPAFTATKGVKSRIIVASDGTITFETDIILP